MSLRLALVTAHPDTADLYAAVIEDAGFVVWTFDLDTAVVPSVDVAVVQLRPWDDAARLARTLRAATKCQGLIALVTFPPKCDPRAFDAVLLLPLSPQDLVTAICELVPC